MNRPLLLLALGMAALMACPRAAHSDEPELSDDGSAESDGPPAETYSPWAAFPVIAFSPETNLVLGGGGVYSFRVDEQAVDDASRKSSVLLLAIASLKRQFSVQVAPSIYLNSESWHVGGALALNRFPDTYFPVGAATEASASEDFDQVGASLQTFANRRVFGSLRIGLDMESYYTEVSRRQPGGVLASNTVPGSDGGYVIGVGPSLFWDNRDNNNASYRGGRYGVSTFVHHAALGSDLDFQRLIISGRHFFPIAPPHVIGVQLYSELVNGDVPFQLVPRLGGESIMRGFFRGRFSDRALVEAQAEYRFPLVWGFSGAAFAAAGDVAARPTELVSIKGKAAAGGGVRYSLSDEDRVKLRFDVAATNTGDVNVYVTLNEAF